MGGLKLYHMDASPPCRSVRMLSHTLGLDIELVEIDLSEGRHLEADFIKINPQHQVPVLDDNGFYLSESRAILCYLVDQYGKDDSLYPREPKKRAVVDQMLNLDAGNLWLHYYQYCIPVFYGEEGDIVKMKKAVEAFELFDKMLEGVKWAAGSNITIADYSLAATVTQAKWANIDIDHCININQWLERVKKEIPIFNEINELSFISLTKVLQTLKTKLQQLKIQ